MRPRAAAPAVRSAALIAAFILGLTAAPPPAFSAAAFTLSSSAFENGARIPDAHTCAGANLSPPLRWTGAPAATRSYALLVADPDAPGGDFVHWVVYDLPAAWRALPSGVGPILRIGGQGGGRQGVNDFHRIGYGGPCPPPGQVHHYVFTLYALDVAQLPVPSPAPPGLVKRALQGRILATAVLTGLFSR
jgi:Raf kinase inhibitor-like YbhB/YbcL family protein